MHSLVIQFAIFHLMCILLFTWSCTFPLLNSNYMIVLTLSSLLFITIDFACFILWWCDFAILCSSLNIHFISICFKLSNFLSCILCTWSCLFLYYFWSSFYTFIKDVNYYLLISLHRDIIFFSDICGRIFAYLFTALHYIWWLTLEMVCGQY